MEYGLSNLELSQEAIEEKCRAYLSLFDLIGYEETFPFHLSHGEKQRLALAAVLSMEPGYLLLDEPTSGLDQKRKKQLGRYLTKIRDTLNCGILIISHDQAFVRQYAQDQIVLGGKANV